MFWYSGWYAREGYGELIHLAQDGAELWRGGQFKSVCSLSFNPADGSCWAADATNGQVVHLVIVPAAQDVPRGHWAFDEVEACYAAGIIACYDDGLYHPEWAVGRDQMAVFISRGLAGGDENVPTGPAEAAFIDVPADHWAFDYVEYAADQRVAGGYDDGLYHPDWTVDRAQMAVYIARATVAPTGEAALADYVPADPMGFPDVASDVWAYRHIEYCAERGVVAGYDDGLYRPEWVVTRDQMAVYIARAFELTM